MMKVKSVTGESRCTHNFSKLQVHKHKHLRCDDLLSVLFIRLTQCELNLKSKTLLTELN